MGGCPKNWTTEKLMVMVAPYCQRKERALLRIVTGLEETTAGDRDEEEDNGGGGGGASHLTSFEEHAQPI